MQLLFELSMTATDKDIVGFKPDYKRNLIISRLQEYELFDEYDKITFQAFLVRPMVTYQRSKATLVELALKLGSMLGILRLITFMIHEVHYRRFQRELAKEASCVQVQTVNITEMSQETTAMLVAGKPREVFSFEAMGEHDLGRRVA